MSKPTLLIFSAGSLPDSRGGGPIRAVGGVVGQLSEEFSFKIVTADRDLGDGAPYEGVPTDGWVPVGDASVRYLPPRLWSLGGLRAILRETDHDALYLNSLFSPVFTLRPLLLRRLGLAPRRPVILAPRGELVPGALADKTAKKKLFLALARAIGLYRHVIWQASSDYEREDIRRHFPGAEVVVARNLASPPVATPGRRHKQAGALSLVYLARIVERKGLAFTLRLLGGLHGKVSLTAYGPQEDPAYWTQCEAIIGALPDNISVRYGGQVPHAEVASRLAEHDLMVLPTGGENFGHSILEALLAGCPVLISDRTPWRDLQTKGVGWDLRLDQSERLAGGLQECVDMDDERWQVLSRQARAFGIEAANDAEAIEQNRQMLRRAAAGQAVPQGESGP